MDYISPDVKKKVDTRLKKKKILSIGNLSTGLFSAFGVWSRLQYDLPNLNWISTSGSGAYLALCLSLKIDIFNFIQTMKTDLTPFQIIKIKYVNYFQLMYRGYLSTDHSGRLNFVQFIIRYATGKDDITFREIVAITGINLVAVVADYNSGKLQYLSSVTTPDFSVTKAILVTTCAVFLWEPIELEIPPYFESRYYYDGSNVDNYPVDAFLSDCSRFALQNYIAYDQKIKIPKAISDNFIGFRLNPELIQGALSVAFGGQQSRNENNPDTFIINSLSNNRVNFGKAQDTSLTKELAKETLQMNIPVPTSFPNIITAEAIEGEFELGVNHYPVLINGYINSTIKFSIV